MIIASFDIGIKNLAYCIMEYQPHRLPGDKFKIYKWDVLDLLDIDSDKVLKITNKKVKTCQIKYKSGQKMGKLCANKPYYRVREASGEVIGICKVHSRSRDQDQIQRHYTVANTTHFELAKLSIPQLDEIDFSMCDRIILESQPHQKMKNFSMMLFNYFVIRYVVDKKESEHNIKDVCFISSKNKLTVYDGPFIPCKLKTQYTRNKFYGKAYCRYMIRENREKLAFFDTFKKKDDLADSYLQGAWYLMYNWGDKLSQAPLLKLDKPKLKLKLKTKSDLIADPVDPDVFSKPKLKLKPKLIGREHLEKIKRNKTNMRIIYDTNYNRYCNLRRGYRPKKSQKRYSLSNIKYFYTRKNFNSVVKSDWKLSSAIKFYFGDLETFVNYLN